MHTRPFFEPLKGVYNLRLRFYLYLTALSLIFPPFVNGGNLSERFFKEDEPVEVEADFISYERDKDTYTADGSVVAVHGGLTLKADRVELDMASGVARASGHVELYDEEGDSLKGETLEIDMREDTAIVMKGRLFFKEDNVRIRGEVIRKTGPRTYASEKTTFTTCDSCEGGTPAWSFYTSSSKTTVGGFFKAWHAFFYIKGVPILYTPFISAPVKRERKTGFLMPGPGYSDLRGFKLDNSFFWAIAENRDATFYLDLETKRGLGKGIEYRYIRKKDGSGELFLYHFRERDIDRVRDFRSDEENLSRPFSAENDRWEVRFKHMEYFGAGLDFKADIKVVSDDEYFIDFADNTDERALESLESTVSLTKRWGQYNLVTEARVFDNLLKKSDATVLQKLPVVTFTGSSQPLFGSPFHTSFESAFANFYRDEGSKGQRLDIFPRLFLPVRPWGLFEFTPSIAPRWTLYRVDDTTGVEDHTRYIYEARADLTTTFTRFFDVQWTGVEKLMHTIRPKLTYTYVPSERQDDLPEFDIVDRIEPLNLFTYSLNMTLTGRFAESGKRHEFLYFDLSQSYDIREARADNDRPFSDVTAELILRPWTGALVTGRGRYDVHDRRFENYDTSLGLKDGRGNELGLTYRFIRNSTEYLEAKAGLRVSKSFLLTYRNRYSFDDDKSIENSYGVEYFHQCWGAQLTYSDRLEENLILLTLKLKGLGEMLSATGKLEME
jgi:LPS-assembly protein